MRKILCAALAAVIPFLMFSCNKSDNPDAIMSVQWYPIELHIYVQDKDSVDLLNYDSVYYVGNDFTLTYGGKTYRVETKYTDEDPELVLLIDNAKRKYCAYFGELDGSKEYDTDFILNWRDGSRDTIHFTRKITDFATSEDTWLLNGSDTGQKTYIGEFLLTK